MAAHLAAGLAIDRLSRNLTKADITYLPDLNRLEQRTAGGQAVLYLLIGSEIMSPTNSVSTGYKETRWHLLKVGANGDVRPFIHFKGWVMLVCVLMIIMLFTVGWFFFLWLALQEELIGAHKVSHHQKQTIESLHSEKDAVLARLAIAQSKLKLANASLATRSQPGLKPEEPDGPIQSESKAKSVEKEDKVKPDQSKDKTAAGPVKVADAPPDEVVIYEKVIADNLFVCAQPDDTSLTVEFKVINMGTRQQPVSGYAFIILKDPDHSQDKWMVLPRAILVNGKPMESRGQRFRIYNFRTIKFKVGHENPGVFTQAAIFIFRNSGELIFERDFNLEPIKICP